MTGDIQIIHALPEHADQLAPLLDAYRCWYGKQSDTTGAQSFIRQRLMWNESEIFFARRHEQAIAFVQLSSTFSSLSLGQIWLIQDLYVVNAARREGVGTVLLDTAVSFVRALGAVRIQLETAQNNQAVRAVCEALGWTRDADTLRYSFNPDDSD